MALNLFIFLSHLWKLPNLQNSICLSFKCNGNHFSIILKWDCLLLEILVLLKQYRCVVTSVLPMDNENRGKDSCLRTLFSISFEDVRTGWFCGVLLYSEVHTFQGQRKTNCESQRFPGGRAESDFTGSCSVRQTHLHSLHLEDGDEVEP